MAQIPTTPGRSRMSTAGGGARIGGFVDAEDMGANNARQWGQLGQAVQGAGQALMQHGINQFESEARAGMSEYRRLVLEQKQKLLQTRGAAAFNAPKEMEEIHRVSGEAAMKGMASRQARERFAKDRMDFDFHNAQEAEQYATFEAERFRMETIDANKQSYLDEIAMNPADGVVFARNLECAKQDIAEQYFGSPPEKILREQRRYAALAVETRAQALAESDGPQAALDFLDSGVAEEIGGGALGRQFDATRTRYENWAISAEQGAAIDAGVAQAIQSVRAGGDRRDVYLQLVRKIGKDKTDKAMGGNGKWAGFVVDAAEAAGAFEAERLAEAASREESAQNETRPVESKARAQAYAGWDEKYAAIVMKAADAEQRTMRAEATREALARDAGLEQELRAAGGNAQAMPSFNALSADERLVWIERGEKYASSVAAMEGKPDLDAYFSLATMTVGELNDRWSDKAVRDADLAAMGGAESTWSRTHIGRIASLAPSEQGGGQTDAPVDSRAFDEDLGYIKHQIEIVSAGAEFDEPARKSAVNRAANAYVDSIAGYMAENRLESIAQIPAAERRRFRAIALLTYIVKPR